MNICEIASNNDPTRIAVYLVELVANNRNLRGRVTRPIVTPPEQRIWRRYQWLHRIFGGVNVGRDFAVMDDGIEPRRSSRPRPQGAIIETLGENAPAAQH